MIPHHRLHGCTHYNTTVFILCKLAILYKHRPLPYVLHNHATFVVQCKIASMHVNDHRKLF